MRPSLLVLVLSVGCGSKSPPAKPPEDTTKPPEPTTRCTTPAPGPGYACVKDCGPPVTPANESVAETWSWLSADDAKKREQFGCPICLPGETRIATPNGERAIEELTVGAAIYTLDRDGTRRQARVLHVDSTHVTGTHHVVHVTLRDGRSVRGSAGHPDASGRDLGALRTGDLLDGSVVASIRVELLGGDRTWDVLPSGQTGLYIADGVVLRSSFWH